MALWGRGGRGEDDTGMLHIGPEAGSVGPWVLQVGAVCLLLRAGPSCHPEANSPKNVLCTVRVRLAVSANC